MPDDSENACLPLGYGMLYNHNPEPNAEVVFDLIIFRFIAFTQLQQVKKFLLIIKM
jgi:hypothetical protein